MLVCGALFIFVYDVTTDYIPTHDIINYKKRGIINHCLGTKNEFERRRLVSLYNIAKYIYEIFTLLLLYGRLN